MSSRRARSMKVQASMNCFVVGHNYVDKNLIYTKYPEWASVVYSPEGFKPITEQKEKYPAMVAPMNQCLRKEVEKGMRRND